MTATYKDQFWNFLIAKKTVTEKTLNEIDRTESKIVGYGRIIQAHARYTYLISK